MPQAVSGALRSLGVDESSVVVAVGLSGLAGVTLAPAPRWMRALWGAPIAAMTLWRRIYVHPALLAGDRRHLAKVVVHELVHVRQWKTSGSARFLTRYFIDYVGNRLRGWSHREAYANIPCEVEARLVESNFEID